MNLWRAFGGLAIGVLGIALVIWQIGWLAGIGITLAVWGNNINQDRGGI